MTDHLILFVLLIDGVLFASTTTSFLMTWEWRRKLNAERAARAEDHADFNAQLTEERRLRIAAEKLAQTALETNAGTESRMTEIQQIHQELLARPVQAMIPTDAIITIGDAVVRYLNGQGDGPLRRPQGPQ